MSEKREASTRREFLAVATGLSVVAGVTFLSGCGDKGGKDGGKGGEKKGGDTAKKGGDAPKAAGGADACDDVSKLTDQEKAMRKQLQYVGKSAKDGQTCDNCQLYIAAKAGASCGGCQVVKGPIAPKGWCASWAKKA